VLTALTKLACGSLVTVPAAVTLLCHVATNDPRRSVRTASLRALRVLVERMGHFTPAACLREAYVCAADALCELHAPASTATLALTILHR
jgi:hypothetical protein